ncbi:biosynthetic-type acetolactate synthase large subunit [Candidatus Sumerlaeota bacterium]|nr:biosynthetic-type acetolactate synthase large subunit [Candidatus Sumerlaeota bacterium]
MKMTGAQIVIDALQKEGVDVIFGFPGGAILDVFDVLDRSPIKFILVRHEQGAAHAADGYARATGKVGVCMATSGPGATNLVTGIATAYMDSVPIVAFTGQVPTGMIGNDAFQEVAIVNITQSITKHNFLVKDVRDLPRIIKEAFYIARTGRPGPVLIDLPKDVQKSTLSDYKYPESVEIRSYKPIYDGHPLMIKKAIAAIERSERPVIYAGGGIIVSNASKELRELAERCDIPVTTTLLGLGAFPETHPLSLKMLGMHGTQYANFAINEADLLIAIGARFDDRVTGKISEFAPNAKDIIHIDIDPSAISKNVKVSIPVVGDCKRTLQKILKNIKPLKHTAWVERCKEWKKQYPLKFKDDDILRPQYVIEQVYKLTKGEAIIVTEVGQHQMWAAHYYNYTKPRTFLSSGGLGTMGYGFPAAIGAQAAFPDKMVIDIAGDGSIQMNIQELATVSSYNLPVKIVVINNHYLGMVRQWQELFYGRNYAYTCLRRRADCPPFCQGSRPECPEFIPDFVKLAEAYGVVGLRAMRKEEVVPALQKAFETPKPALVDCWVYEEENVFPMIPAGASIKQMIGGMA